jgi:hypothetical protein
VTRDLGFSGLIRRIAPFSCLSRHTRGCGGSTILTRILTGESAVWYIIEWRCLRNHEVHLHGVGGRTIQRVFDRDLPVVRRPRPGVIFLQLGGNDIGRQSSPTDVFVKLKRLVTVLRREIPDCIRWARFSVVSDPEEFVSSYKRRKNRVNKFLSREFGAFEQGKKFFRPSPTYSLVGTSTVTEYTSMII